MVKFFWIGIVVCLASCNNSGLTYSKFHTKDATVLSSDSEEIKKIVSFNSFDTTVEVVFWDTYDSISECQKNNYEGFVHKQDSLWPYIMDAVFKDYKENYQDYKEGWTSVGKLSKEQLEKNLPSPTTPERLKAFISPESVYIPNKNNCEVGTIGMEFDCPWDMENGIGVYIKNWKVVKVGTAEVSYP